MTDQDDQPAPETTPARPQIMLTFAGPGMADFAIAATPDIEPAQVYAAAFVIDAWAREIRAGVELERARTLAARETGGLYVPNREQRRHGPVS